RPTDDRHSKRYEFIFESFGEYCGPGPISRLDIEGIDIPAHRRSMVKTPIQYADGISMQLAIIPKREDYERTLRGEPQILLEIGFYDKTALTMKGAGLTFDR